MRTIKIIGGIDSDSYKEFSAQLDTFEVKPKEPVLVELNSEGGSAYDALAFYDRIRLSTCDIEVRVFGQCSSAAVLVLAAGDRRSMTSSAWVLVHEDSTEEMLTDKRVGQAEKDLRHLRRLEEQWNRLLEFRTGTPEATWAALHSNETYLSAEECANLGLIHEIV